MAITATLKTLPLGALALLVACTAVRQDAPSAVAAPVEVPRKTWEEIATTADVDRIAGTRAAWDAALADARKHGFAKAIVEEGELLDPAVALPRAAPPPGSYNCRVIKIGAKARREPAFAAYKPFFCYVEAEGELLTIVKQTGSQRPAGRLYPDSDQRMVFLGTLALGSEEAPIAYNENAERDMAGVVERVAPFRWRLVIPWPQSKSKLDVFELVPTPQ